MKIVDELVNTLKNYGVCPEVIEDCTHKLKADLNELLKMQIENKITFRGARENKHLSINEVAEKTGIPARIIRRYEIDSRKAAFDHALILSKLYCISLDHLFIGCVSAGTENHLNMSLAGR